MLRWFPVALLAAALVNGCASGGAHVDPCESAIDRLVDECGYEAGDLQDLELNCTGQSACVAGCLEKSPCADIAANDGEFADCVATCQ